MTHELLDLVELVETEDEKDETSVIVRSFELSADRTSLIVNLELVSWYSDARFSRVLECFKPYRWLFTEAECVRVLVSGDHPAALPFPDRTAELTFRGTADDPSALADELREAHDKYVGEYIDFDSVTNKPLSELLSGGFGQIAAGPKSLLERFERIAESAGLVTTLRDCGPAAYFVDNEGGGGEWVEIPVPPSVIDFGGAFVVAERFVVAESRELNSNART